jgi:hypothetical protein
MSDEIDKSVRIGGKKALAKAKLRPGLTQAWDALEECPASTILSGQRQLS